MVKLDNWSTPGKIKKELHTRLQDAKKKRGWLERLWVDCIKAVYKNKSGVSDGIDFPDSGSFAGANGEIFRQSSLSGDDEIPSEPQAFINNIMRNVRYTHSQFSANPPVVIPRPTSSDPEDKRRADAADRCVRYGVREYKLQELKDVAIWWCLVTGTAFMKGVWDPDRGEFLEFDEASGEMTMEGDYHAS